MGSSTDVGERMSAARHPPTRRRVEGLRRILVVEDEALIALDLSDMLQRNGFEVVAVVDSGPAALESAEQLAPELILMDIHIAGPFDGIEAMHRIVARHDVPVVFLTAFADAPTIGRAAELAPYGYLIKPIDATALTATVRTALERHDRDIRSRWVEYAFDAAAVSISILDVEGRVPVVKHVNHGFTELFGISREDAVGREFCFGHAEDDADGVARLRDAVAALRGHAETIACRDTRGRLFFANVSVAPVPSRTGATRHVTVAHVDVTAQLSFEASLADNQRVILVGRLAAGLVHDLNNLLSISSSFASLVRDDLAASTDRPVDAQLLDDLEEVVLAGKRAGLLTRRLLDLSRQRTQPSYTVVELGRVLRECRRVLEHAAGAGVRLDIHAGPGRLFLDGDPLELEQILLNLVVNARDAMPTGGRVTITAAQPGEASPNFLGGQFVRLTVQDDGEGMSTETLAHAFDPLFTTKPVGVGTGLGLYNTRSMVTRAGGRVSLESAPGQGTLVTLEFPMRAALEPQHDTGDTPLPVEGEVLRGVRCLVVEGDPLVRKVMVRTLERVGCEVIGVPTAALAFDALTRALVELVIVDKTVERASTLVDSAGHRQAAVILTTGVAEPGESPRASVLLKPFTASALVRSARGAVVERRRRHQADVLPRKPIPAEHASVLSHSWKVTPTDAIVAAIRAARVTLRPLTGARDGVLHGHELVFEGHNHPWDVLLGRADPARAAHLRRALREVVAEELDRERHELVFVPPSVWAVHDDLAESSGDDPLFRHADRIGLRCGAEAAPDPPQREALRRAGFRLVVDEVGASWTAIGDLLQLGPDYAILDPALLEDVSMSPARADALGAMIGLLRKYDVIVVARASFPPDVLAVVVDRGCDLLIDAPQAAVARRPSRSEPGIR